MKINLAEKIFYYFSRKYFGNISLKSDTSMSERILTLSIPPTVYWWSYNKEKNPRILFFKFFDMIKIWKLHLTFLLSHFPKLIDDINDDLVLLRNLKIASQLQNNHQLSQHGDDIICWLLSRAIAWKFENVSYHKWKLISWESLPLPFYQSMYKNLHLRKVTTENIKLCLPLMNFDSSFPGREVKCPDTIQ